MGVGVVEGTAGFFRRFSLKGLHRLRTYANPPTLGFYTRAASGRSLVSYGKWVKRLEMG